MTDAPELLPCPFCGDVAQVAGSLFFCDAIIVRCANGHSNGCLYADRDDAIAAWNRRATPAALADSPEVQALIREAEARGYNNGMLVAISVVSEERNKRNPGPLFEVLNKALGKIDDARFSAIRKAEQ